MVTRYALIVLNFLFWGQPSIAQELLPLDIEASYCLGVMDVQDAGARALIEGMPPDLKKSLGELPPIPDTRESIRVYLLARGVLRGGSVTVVSALQSRGQNDARACISANERIPMSCQSDCMKRHIRGTTSNEFSAAVDACTSKCEGGPKRDVLCAKIKRCDTIKDRLPL